MQRLPDDIPGREALLKSGFTNYAVLRNHGPIQTIRGIDNKTAKKIREYMAGKKSEPEESTDYPVHKGGGYYLLSSGEQVRGKDEAIQAESQLK